MATLMVEKDDTQSEIYMYMPENRQVRRVSPRTMGRSMLGTDLSYEDFAHFQRISNTGHATRLDDSVIDGNPVYGLETIPDEDESDYARILTYVDHDVCLPLKTEFFAPNGSIHKELFVERNHVRKVSDRWVPFYWEMVDHERDSRTVLMTSDVEINPRIRDSYFTPSELNRGR